MVVEAKTASPQLPQQEMLQTILNAIPNPVYQKDPDGVYQLCNRAFCEMLDMPSEQIIGRTTAELVADTEAGFFSDKLDEVVHMGRSASRETDLVGADGRTRRVMFSKADFDLPSGEPGGAVVVLTDMTERKKIEMDLHLTNKHLEELNRRISAQQNQLIQSEKMASLGQLAAGIAHEINNPVAFIMSNIGTLVEYMATFKSLLDNYEILSRAEADGDDAIASETRAKIQQTIEDEDLEFIRGDIDKLLSETMEGTDRVRDIVANLKSFARLDDVSIQSANINECIESTLRVVWNELKYTCEVHNDLQPVPPVGVAPGSLNQVILNLVVNASQAIGENGNVWLSTRRVGDMVECQVRDDGIGIPRTNLVKVFDPFFTTKDVGKGTGLGLSIIHGIVTSKGGTISVNSEEGKGSTFTIRLPIEADDGTNEEQIILSEQDVDLEVGTGPLDQALLDQIPDRED